MCQKKKRSVSAFTGIATFFHGGGPGKTLMREVLERPDGRWSRTPFQSEMLVISELSVTVHALRSPSCPPGGTDLVALRDEFARAMTATFFFFGTAVSEQIFASSIFHCNIMYECFPRSTEKIGFSWRRLQVSVFSATPLCILPVWFRRWRCWADDVPAVFILYSVMAMTVPKSAPTMALTMISTAARCVRVAKLLIQRGSSCLELDLATTFSWDEKFKTSPPGRLHPS